MARKNGRRSTCASTTTPIRLRELERLEQVSRERWVHFRKFLPTRKNPAGITDRATIDAGIEAGDCGRAMTADPLIEIEGLRVVFHGDDGRTTHAVDSVDLERRQWRDARAGRRDPAAARA